MTLPFDPFAPETTEYSPEKFYTRSEDLHHHSSALRWGSTRGDMIAVPKHVVQRMAAIKEVAPMLRTNMDVMRDALIHYFHMRGQQFKTQLPQEWHEELDRLTQTAEIERLQESRRQHETILAKIEECLRDSRNSVEEKYEALVVCERAAMSLSIPAYIRKASEIIERYRDK